MIDFKEYQNEINKICQKHHVKRLTAFGSALSDQFDESSDIDFLLEVSPFFVFVLFIGPGHFILRAREKKAVFIFA